MSLLAFLLALLVAQAPQRTYHPMPLVKMAAQDPAHWKGMRTHVLVEGFVTYVKTEEDGDLHIRICDSASIKVMDRAHCIVAEAIPSLPVKKPKLGAKVTVWGISRYDGENGHKWHECHPIERLLEVVP